MNLTYERAIQIAGHLSYPSKMPCPSWGIDPKHCKIGAKLRKQKGTTCSICYACRGHYNYPRVRQRQQERLEGISHYLWVDAMIVIIRTVACSHFRWFDSGDIQDEIHLLKIFLIATRLPEVQFWLPTQEHRLANQFKHEVPQNLTLRLTNAVINPCYDVRTDFPVAEVITYKKEDWPDRTHPYYCPADGAGEKKCGVCRACWDKTIPMIVYRRS